jgi:hypothetical protein
VALPPPPPPLPLLVPEVVVVVPLDEVPLEVVPLLPPVPA